MPEMSKTEKDQRFNLGKLAYEAFCANAYEEVPSGIPSWYDLDDNARKPWIAAAALVADYSARSQVKELVSAPKSPFFGLGIGRVVHYVNVFGDHLAAIIAAVDDKDKGIVTLSVFATHPLRDETNILSMFRVNYGEVPAQRTWHWPEFVE